MHIDTDCSEAESNLDARRMANELREALECGEDTIEALTEFHAKMAGYESKSYAILMVTGGINLADAFVWWMDDQSILIVGWQDEETVVAGVLPPGAEFTPAPYYDDAAHTLH